MLSHGATISLQESIERPILPPEQGEVRRSRIGGGERSEPISRMIIIPYDIDRLIRNADFISIAAERQSTTLGPKGRCPPLSASEHNPSAQPAALAAPLFYKTCGEAATTTL